MSFLIVRPYMNLLEPCNLLGIQLAVLLDMWEGNILELVVRKLYLALELAYSIAFQQEVEAVHFGIPAKASMPPERVYSIANQAPLKGNMGQTRPRLA